MKVVIANWKMNPMTAKESKLLFETVVSGVVKLKNVETVICPPFCYLSLFKPAKGVKLGGQNLFWELQGAYTGEISGKMLKNLGCGFVIVGHSERRLYAGESDEIINAKLKAALQCGLRPVLCIGERVGEEIGEVLTRQLTECLRDISKGQIKELIVAYEPVWAIGTGNACSPENAFRASLLIKKILTGLYSRFLAEKTPVLYGGSVDSQNASDYIKESQMQGLLVGGASLGAEEFIKIVKSVNSL